jgi:hypothetical protein
VSCRHTARRREQRQQALTAGWKLKSARRGHILYPEKESVHEPVWPHNEPRSAISEGFLQSLREQVNGFQDVLTVGMAFF